MTITIDNAATMIKQHAVVFAPEIKSAIRQGLEFEAFLPPAAGDKFYACGNVTIGNVMQPYQTGFTPRGSVTHNEDTIAIRPIKIDLEFSEADLEGFYDSYYTEWFEAGRDPKTWTYPKYIYDTHIMPKFMEELNTASWDGQYVAPTAGTPGAPNESVDGFKKVIADAVTGSKINVIATGTFTASDIREKVEAFLDAIPEAAKKGGGRILMSTTNKRLYFRDYRSEFTQLPTIVNTDTGPKRVFVDDYNVEILGVAAMGGSNRWIYLPNNHNDMKWITRRGYPAYPNLIVDSSPRAVQLYGTFYRGYGFEYGKNVWINNQV